MVADRTRPAGRDDFDALVGAVVKALTDAGAIPAAGLTVEDAARVLRVGPDKIRTWIRAGELVATNTAAARSGKPRWVISREALDVFRKGRTSAPTPKAPKRRRASGQTDFFPGD